MEITRVIPHLSALAQPTRYRCVSGLLRRHVEDELTDADQFVELAIRLEHVHLVTESENQNLLAQGGDYERAGVSLVSWDALARYRRLHLWSRHLKGKVANASSFRT